MPFLVFVIVLSLSFYVFYKIKYVRSKRPMEKRMLNGKSSLALGIFVAFFGINQLFLYDTTTTYIIAAIFIILGSFSAWVGFRTYRHHVPYVLREAEDLAKE
ncbi:YtpI family protein [Lederbergia graminis]|uniref:YtpI family protein n=1 Tax=Lederbergia graminis TaxID=735518 RepID=A0ABW0LHV3_9BACI|nr:YtpI family protein [Paenibacillus bovis]HLU22527.1 YtpI family protein [Bacillaceae bacterium]